MGQPPRTSFAPLETCRAVTMMMKTQLGSLATFRLFFLCLVLGLIFPAEGYKIVDLRSAPPEGPPMRPDHFRSVAELNKYLADLTDYYTVLGRPRFGKRTSDGSGLPLVLGYSNFKRKRQVESLMADDAPQEELLWNVLGGRRR